MAQESSELTGSQRTIIILVCLFLAYYVAIVVIPKQQPTPEQLDCVQAQVALCEAQGHWFCPGRAQGLCGIK